MSKKSIARARRSKQKEGFDLAAIVQQMIDKEGLDAKWNGTSFEITTEGLFTTYKSEVECCGNSINISTPFGFPVRKSVRVLAKMEGKRISDTSSTAMIMEMEDEVGYRLASITNMNFKFAPSVSYVKRLLMEHVSLIDGENCVNLVCAIVGCADYDELEPMLRHELSLLDGDAPSEKFSIPDGYAACLPHCKTISYARFLGRLFGMMDQIIIEELPGVILKDYDTVPYVLPIVYAVASCEERDVIRKLWYLTSDKSDRKHYGKEIEMALGEYEARTIYTEDGDLYDLLRDA